ncbi:MAG: hypothetical protein R2849_08010 [Thermomicrobiales bacterium]
MAALENPARRLVVVDRPLAGDVVTLALEDGNEQAVGEQVRRDIGRSTV